MRPCVYVEKHQRVSIQYILNIVSFLEAYKIKCLLSLISA